VSTECQSPSLRQSRCHTKCQPDSEYHFLVYRVSIIPNLTVRRSSTVNIRLMRTLLLPLLRSLSSLPNHPSKSSSSPIRLTDNRNTRREEGNIEVASRNASPTPYLVPVHFSDFFTRSKLGKSRWRAEGEPSHQTRRAHTPSHWTSNKDNLPTEGDPPFAHSTRYQITYPTSFTRLKVEKSRWRAEGEPTHQTWRAHTPSHWTSSKGNPPTPCAMGGPKASPLPHTPLEPCSEVCPKKVTKNREPSAGLKRCACWIFPAGTLFFVERQTCSNCNGLRVRRATENF
jgi:hypothetical protein